MHKRPEVEAPNESNRTRTSVRGSEGNTPTSNTTRSTPPEGSPLSLSGLHQYTNKIMSYEEFSADQLLQEIYDAQYGQQTEDLLFSTEDLPEANPGYWPEQAEWLSLDTYSSFDQNDYEYQQDLAGGLYDY